MSHTVMFIGNATFTNAVVNGLLMASICARPGFRDCGVMGESNVTVEDSMEIEESIIEIYDEDNKCIGMEEFDIDGLFSIDFLCTPHASTKITLKKGARDNAWDVRFVEVELYWENERFEELLAQADQVVIATCKRGVQGTPGFKLPNVPVHYIKEFMENDKSVKLPGTIVIDPLNHGDILVFRQTLRSLNN